MIKLMSCIWMWTCLSSGISPIFAQEALLQREIGKIIRHESNIDFSLVPGVIVGILDQDSTFVFSFGKGIQEDGIYELGSVTKPIVSWLAARALDSLEWDLSTPVCRFMPDSLCSGNWEGLTINQILQHMSGLARFPPEIGRHETSVQDPFASYGLSIFAREIQSMNPRPGVYSYSHTGYALLYWLFEKVGGLEAFTKRKLTEPLGLVHTAWTFQDHLLSPGHGFDGRKQPPWHANALATAIGLKSGVRDLLHFIRYINPELSGRIPSLTPLLKKELSSLDKTDAYKVQDGWFLIRLGANLVYYHTGRTGGHHVSIAFSPQKDKAVVVISNGALGSNELSLSVLRMLLRAKPQKE